MVDVGKPYYGQLQKVQGAESGNVDVTAEPAPPVRNSQCLMLIYCPYYRKSQSIVVVQARWSVDFGLDNSVVEHLTSDAGVPGSTPSPTILFSFVFLSFICVP